MATLEITTLDSTNCARGVRAASIVTGRIAAKVWITACLLLALPLVPQASAASPRGGEAETSPSPAPAPSFTTSLQDQLLLDARDGELDEFTFLEASLIASGVERSEQLRACRRYFLASCDRFRGQQAEFSSTRDFAASLLAFLHQEILTDDYQIETTRVDQALQTGRYNCVAAAILFRCLGGELGAQPVVMATPSHVFCRFPGLEPLDVETTCPNWFELPPSAEIVVRHPANQAPSELRQLSEVEVLGKLFYNRATDQLEAEAFASACQLLRIARALDPGDRSARENHLAAINNWALQRCEAGDFAQAARLIQRGFAISPDYEPIRMNDLHVHQKWAMDLCRRGQFTAALSLLSDSYQRRPDVQLFDQGRFAVYGLWADSLFDKGQDLEALKIFDRALDHYPGHLDVGRRESVSILRAVQTRWERGQRQEARQLLERGLLRQPDCPELKSQARDLTILKS